MPNILQMQEILKTVPDQRLMQEMQQPTGRAPTFLVMTELQRRKKVRDEYQGRVEEEQTTVVEDMVRGAAPQQPPAPPGGMASLAPPSPMQSQAPMQPPGPPPQAGPPIRAESGGALYRQAGSTGGIQLSSDDIARLGKLVEGEAGNQGDEGRRAVVAVVMNRVRSPHFPNTIKEVIEQKGQFNAVDDRGGGKVDEMPVASSGTRNAVLQLLASPQDQNPVGDALYYQNPEISDLIFPSVGKNYDGTRKNFTRNNEPFDPDVKKVGDHVFTTRYRTTDPQPRLEPAVYTVQASALTEADRGRLISSVGTETMMSFVAGKEVVPEEDQTQIAMAPSEPPPVVPSSTEGAEKEWERRYKEGAAALARGQDEVRRADQLAALGLADDVGLKSGVGSLAVPVHPSTLGDPRLSGSEAALLQPHPGDAHLAALGAEQQRLADAAGGQPALRADDSIPPVPSPPPVEAAAIPAEAVSVGPPIAPDRPNVFAALVDKVLESQPASRPPMNLEVPAGSLTAPGPALWGAVNPMVNPPPPGVDAELLAYAEAINDPSVVDIPPAVANISPLPTQFPDTAERPPSVPPPMAAALAAQPPSSQPLSQLPSMAGQASGMDVTAQPVKTKDQVVAQRLLETQLRKRKITPRSNVTMPEGYRRLRNFLRDMAKAPDKIAKLEEFKKAHPHLAQMTDAKIAELKLSDPSYAAALKGAPTPLDEAGYIEPPEPPSAIQRFAESTDDPAYAGEFGMGPSLEDERRPSQLSSQMGAVPVSLAESRPIDPKAGRYVIPRQGGAPPAPSSPASGAGGIQELMAQIAAGRDDAKAMGLLTAGLGMMQQASQPGATFLSSIPGAQAGVKQYSADKANLAKQQMALATLANQQEATRIAAQKAAQLPKYQAVRENLRAAKYNDPTERAKYFDAQGRTNSAFEELVIEKTRTSSGIQDQLALTREANARSTWEKLDKQRAMKLRIDYKKNNPKLSDAQIDAMVTAEIERQYNAWRSRVLQGAQSTVTPTTPISSIIPKTG